MDNALSASIALIAAQQTRASTTNSLALYDRQEKAFRLYTGSVGEKGVSIVDFTRKSLICGASTCFFDYATRSQIHMEYTQQGFKGINRSTGEIFFGTRNANSLVIHCSGVRREYTF